MARRDFTVYVDEVRKTDTGRIVVTATNGGEGGPPQLVFQVPNGEKAIWTIGKRVEVTLEWET